MSAYFLVGSIIGATRVYLNPDTPWFERVFCFAFAFFLWLPNILFWSGVYFILWLLNRDP